MQIRSVAPLDFAEWEQLWKGYNAFYGRTGATELPDVVTKMTWARFFDAYEPIHAIVAESDGHLLGLVHYILHRNTIRIEPTCYLQDLFTVESARGKGVGRALIEAVYERAKTAGVKHIYWHDRLPDERKLNYRIPEPFDLADHVVTRDAPAAIELFLPIPDSRVYFTTDGSVPNTTSSGYAGGFIPVPPGFEGTIKAIVKQTNGRPSSVFEVSYSRWVPNVPRIMPPPLSTAPRSRSVNNDVEVVSRPEPIARPSPSPVAKPVNGNKEKKPSGNNQR